MNNQRIELQFGYVLHRRAYHETSLIIDVFTKNYGRCSMVAKGVRQLKSRRRALLQSFVPNYFSWWGNGDLYTLTQLEAVAQPHHLLPQQLICGLYANELLLHLLPREDPHPELFSDYRHLLQTLSTRTSTQTALRIFEKRLLQHLGYGLSLQYEYDSQCPIVAEHYYRLNEEQGFIMTTADHGMAISGDSLIALHNEVMTPIQLKKIKGLMRQVLKRLLGERPLYCRTLFI